MSRNLSPLRLHGPWIALLLFLTILVLGAPLFSDSQILSAKGNDIFLQYFHSRSFGFGELAKGNIPFWNPYLYCGVPFMADFQSALLYPPNLIFLFLPIVVALNWSIAIHVFILGIAMYAWSTWRGIQRPAAFLAAATAILGGPFFLHIYAGHLSNICTMAWAPLVFLGIDGWLAKRHIKWLLLSAAAVTLQIYAGHPQYVYYTALVAGIYSIVFLIGSRRAFAAAMGLLAIYPLAILLGAAQLLPGYYAATESVRSSGLYLDYAAMFSLPPENLITSIAPWFFGNMQSVAYWGRGLLWEMSLYSGIGSLILGLHGLLHFKKSDRIRLGILLAATLLLALGAHTPLYKFLYTILPGFSTFRGTSKFIFFFGMFVSLLAGTGFDHLLRKDFPTRRIIFVWLGLGILLLVVGFSISHSAPWWSSTFQTFSHSKEGYLHQHVSEPNQILSLARLLSAHSLEIAGLWFIALTALLLTSNRWRWSVWIIGAVCILDLFIFAKSSVESFSKKEVTYPDMAKFLEQNPGDYRTINLFNPDASISLRTESLWGYDPSVLKRYAEFLFFTQGLDPNQASQYLEIHGSHPLLSLLRTHFILPNDKGVYNMPGTTQPYPHFFVVSSYKVIPKRDAIFTTLNELSFDPKSEVILESEPDPKPGDHAAKGTVDIIDSSNDHWTLDINTDQPVILVMTDAYSKDWHANALPGSAQKHYNILPADYTLRSIPLSAGHHLIRIEYIPSGFYFGIVVTLVTLAALASFIFIPSLRKQFLFAKL
ncbi:MAG: hypothetical protein ABI443_00230 [Chthoniobacterales bacterium]